MNSRLGNGGRPVRTAATVTSFAVVLALVIVAVATGLPGQVRAATSSAPAAARTHAAGTMPTAAGPPSAAAIPLTPSAATLAPDAATTTSCPSQPTYTWLPITPDCWPLVTEDQPGPTQEVTSGITHSDETIESIGGKQQAQILNVDLGNPNVRTDMVEAGDTLVDPSDETVSSMANRSGAVAGINADFFEIAGQGDPVGMAVKDGNLLKSPNPTGYHADFLMLKDGTPVITGESFSGTITDGSATYPLAAVNTFDPNVPNSITLDTPANGAENITQGRVAVGQVVDNGAAVHITRVDLAQKSLPALTGDEEDVVAIGAAPAAWMAANVKAGDTIQISDSLSPYPLSEIQTAVSGGGILEQNGQMAVPVQGTGENNQDNPVTGLGISKDNKHLIIAVFDGHQPEDSAEGLTRPEQAQWMIQHGAENAILFDSGGSSDMVARMPGQTSVSVMNTPSDGQERHVANGLFFYSTETSPGAPTAVHVDGDKPLSTARGVASNVAAYAVDAAGNPTSVDPVTVTAIPSRLGTWSNGVFTAGSPGEGRLMVRSGDVVASVPLTVKPTFDKLAISPSNTDIGNGATQQYTVTGTNTGGSPVSINASSITWKLSDPSLGSISSSGLFTAAASGSGTENVTATVGSATATAILGVGSVSATVFTADDASQWATTLHNATTVPASGFTNSTDVPPNSNQTQSISLQYAFPNTTAVHQVVFYPRGNVPDVGPNAQGQTPTSVTFRLKVTDANPQDLQFYYAYIDSTGTARDVNTPVPTLNKWFDLTMPLPTGSAYPLELNYLDLLNQHATAAENGTLTFGGMLVNYAVDTTPVKKYVAIDPNNPRWLSFDESAADFSPGGSTLLFGDDSHLVASDPNSTSAQNIEDMAKRTAGQTYTTSAGQPVAPLPANAKPNTAVSLGDIADDGALADLQYAKSEWDTFGVPLYDIVGNHETSQGSDPENNNWYKVFGQNTHFTFTDGPATFIGLDNSQGSIPASDPYQDPAEQQYPWFVKQLDAATTPVVIVGIHMPAYDPGDDANDSQFSDRWDANQFLQVIEDYQQTHRHKHVVVVYGHSRGFSDQFIDPQGNEGTGKTGIVQLTIADVGMPAYKPADQGGFFHFGLVHVSRDGHVQFAVEPMLKSVTIDQGTAAGSSSSAGSPGADKADTVTPGQKLQLSATAINNNGDNNTSPPTMPVADPMSHVWTSSDPGIARVDPVTGELTALRPGRTRISVSTGGITANLLLTVR